MGSPCGAYETLSMHGCTELLPHWEMYKYFVFVAAGGITHLNDRTFEDIGL